MSGALAVCVAGARGRLGSLVCEAVAAAPDLNLSATLVRGQRASEVLSGATLDVLVDVSLAPASRQLVPLALELGIATVVGTSGLSGSDLEAMDQASRRAGVGALVVPNFSLGAVLQMQAAAAIAPHLPCRRLLETHHPAKRDAPSATALATAAAVAAATGGHAPAITSERREGCVARQELRFGDEAEQLTLVHEVADRRAYLPGVLLAVRRVRSLRGLHQGLAAVLEC